MARVTVIVNPRSGKPDTDQSIAMLRETLAPAVKSLTLHEIRKGSEIAQAARDAVAGGSDIVAALGGDGTQSAVAGALAGTGAMMAVLPGGTFNYFAREIGVETMEAAIGAILSGRTAPRAIGSINDRVFLNNASVGLYPRIIQSREAIYRRWGRSRIAAYWSVLVTLTQLRRPMHLSVLVGEEMRVYETSMAFVSRSAYQLDRLGLEGAEAVRDGHFALFVARATSRSALLAASLRLAFGRMARGADFDLVISDSFEIVTPQRRRSVAVDGEQDRMSTPLRLKVLKSALRVVVPPVPPEDPAGV